MVAENEDDLQRLLHQFNLVAKSFNMVVSASKLEVNGSIIQQEMTFT